MDKISQIRNTYIDTNRNVMTKYVRVKPTHVLGSTTAIYDNRFIVDVPNLYNGLSQIYIKNTVTKATGSVAIQLLGMRIFKSIILRGKISGNIIARITPQYNIARYEELGNTPLYTTLERSTQGDFTSSLTQTFYTPVPMWFCGKNKELQTRFLEDLQLECIVNDSAAAMGLSQEITAASYEVIFKYYDDVIIKPYSLPREIVGYDIYQEAPESITVSTAGDKKTILLTCPFPTYITYIYAYGSTQTLATISNVKIESSNVEISDIDNDILYDYNDQQNINVNSNGNVSIYWTKYFGHQYEDVNTSYVNFVGAMYPTRAICTIETTGSLTLEVVHEYSQHYKINENGTIGRSLMNESSPSKTGEL